MCCRIIELREKQVISIRDGNILGFVGDVEIDTGCGRLISIIIYGKRKCFGLFGRENDCRIPWESIEVIGEDSILVNFDFTPVKYAKRKIFNELFGN